MNLYEVLGVKRTSTQAKIKAAFRERSKDLHPDAGGSDKAFAELNSAYMTLRDKDRRKKYDETGEIDSKGVDSDLARLSNILRALFDAVIRGGLAECKEVDVIKEMRGCVQKEIEDKKRQDKKLSKELDAAMTLKKRISCRNERDLLGSIIDARVRVLEHSKIGLDQNIRLLAMVKEELSDYDCLVEVARMVNLYFMGGITSTTSTTA